MISPTAREDKRLRRREARRPRLDHVWTSVQGWLRSYGDRWTIPTLLHLDLREGRYVLSATVALLLLGWIAASLPYDSIFAAVGRGGMLILVLYYLIDSFLVHTTIAFVSRSPAVSLRSALLTFWSFINFALAFAVLHLLQRKSYTIASVADPHAEIGLIQGIFLSFVTLATLGGPIGPKADQPLALATVAAEVIGGLYLVTVIIAVITGWAGDDA